MLSLSGLGFPFDVIQPHQQSNQRTHKAVLHGLAGIRFFFKTKQPPVIPLETLHDSKKKSPVYTGEDLCASRFFDYLEYTKGPPESKRAYPR